MRRRLSWGSSITTEQASQKKSVNSTIIRAARLAPAKHGKIKGKTREGKPTEPQLLQVLEPPATAALHFGQVECAIIVCGYECLFFCFFPVNLRLGWL
jgi:hypothetical protein